MITKSHLPCYARTTPTPYFPSEVCGWSFFLKLWQHLLLAKKYLWSLAHWLSLRYSSSRNRFAFIKAVGTVWCSLSAMDFNDIMIWQFISSVVNMGIFSYKILQPSTGNCTETRSSLVMLTVVLDRFFCATVNLTWNWVNNIFVFTCSDVFVNLFNKLCLCFQTFKQITRAL